MSYTLGRYLATIGLDNDLDVSTTSLNEIQSRHFHKIPFNNFSMHENYHGGGLSYDFLFENIILNRQGGICFEHCAILSKVFEDLGFDYKSTLARVHIPVTTGKTHQIFIVQVHDEEWVFDVGFGAKGPRAILKLTDGYEHKHDITSSRVTKSDNGGWIVSVNEHHLNSGWEKIYSFHNIHSSVEDIDIAYYYTLWSPNSLLNQNKVISLPNINGRRSIRNDTFTDVTLSAITQSTDLESSTIETLKNSFFV